MDVDRGRQALLTVLGISAGVAAGVWLWRRQATPEMAPVLGWPEPRGSAQDVSDSLRRDGKLSRRRIEVDSIAEGVIELSGSVRDRAESERAVGIAQSTTGVYTVVNRLRIEEEETQRSATRRRWNEGAPELRERKHYGMGVGMGTRRQSPSTDPDRPSDKQRMVERELDVSNMEDTPASGADGAPDATASGEGELKPGDERAIREAGLDPTPPSNGAPAEASPDEGASGEREEDRG